MAREFSEYKFDSLTTPISSYDPTKINLGFCMKKSTDSSGRNYVGPLENKFFRIYETYTEYGGTVGSLEYNSNTVWFFHIDYTNSAAARKVYMHIYNKSADTMTFQGTVSLTGYGSNNLIQLTPSMENHTAGTVSVSGTTVTGSGTSWKTDGSCAGNRIGFGSTDPSLITTWYEIASITNDGQLNLTGSAGTIDAGTSYVIEDFRLIYVNYSNGTQANAGLTIAKGLRPEIFTLSSTTIGLSSTVDNIRAVYRLANAVTNSYLYYGNTLMNKVSLTEQYSYASTGTSTTVSIQKFNVRAALTVSSGTATNAFILSTGSQAHSGTAILGGNTACRAIYGGIENIFIATATRIIRIIPSNVTSGSTTFISDSMAESPPGGTNTFALTSSFRSISWLSTINRFVVTTSYSAVPCRFYIFSYSPGGSFERAISATDNLQVNSYTSFDVNTYPTDSFGGATQYFDMSSSGGIMMVSRYVPTSSNTIMHTFLPEADELYESTTNSHIITPELSTSGATALGRIRIESEMARNANYTLYPREYYKIYYRTSGISGNTGSWTLLNEAGDLSSITPASSIQFKITFRTMGISTVADKIYGLVVSYTTNNDPESTTFYEPSIQFSDKTIGRVSWRQRATWETTNIPNLRIKMYQANTSTLLLNDTTAAASLGTWQYSSDGGSTWNSWSSSANAVGNYIRYTPTASVGSGLAVKIKLFEA